MVDWKERIGIVVTTALFLMFLVSVIVSMFGADVGITLWTGGVGFIGAVFCLPIFFLPSK